MRIEKVCPIWGTEAEVSDVLTYLSTMVRAYQVDSERTGGCYVITEPAIETIDYHYSANDKAKLTTWIVDQRLQGNATPTVTRDTLIYASSRPSLSVPNRAERLLRFIANQIKTTGEFVAFAKTTLAAYAWSESINWEEVIYFFDYLHETGWIKGQAYIGGNSHYTLTVDGYSRITDLATNSASSQAFVAMWFDSSMDDAYENGIKLAIEACGYRCMRIDKKDGVDKIDDAIIAEIRQSRFLIADFTQEGDKARGGVYFEAGFALGLGLRVVYSCREDVFDNLHFDTRQYFHVPWNTPEELQAGLKKQILARVGQGPLPVKA